MWPRLRDGLIIVIGVAMIALMVRISNEQAAGRSRGYETRAVACRTLLVLNQPLEKDPQCNNPNVLKLVRQVPIRVTAAGKTACSIAEVNNMKVPKECGG